MQRAAPRDTSLRPFAVGLIKGIVIVGVLYFTNFLWASTSSTGEIGCARYGVLSLLYGVGLVLAFGRISLLHSTQRGRNGDRSNVEQSKNRSK